MLLRKPVLEYYLCLTLKAMAWIGLIYLGIFALGAIGSVVAFRSFGPENMGSTSIMGVDAMFAFAFMIICASDFQKEFQFMFQHGVSRRSAYVGFLATIAVASLVGAVAIFSTAMVFNWIAGLLPGNVATSTIFGQAYAAWLANTSTPLGALTSILFYWALLFMTGSIGYFGSIVFHRLDKFGRTILIGGSISLGISLPLLNNFSNGRLAQFALWLWSVFVGQGETANPWSGMGVFLVFAVIVLIPSWLLIRRITLKK